MNTRITLFFWGIALSLIIGVSFWYFRTATRSLTQSGSGIVVQEVTGEPEAGRTDDAATEPEDGIIDLQPVVSPVSEPTIWENVFFTSQAPTGEWGKSEFQNGCEEASALMVHAWRTGKVYTKETAKAELVAMARYQEEQIGHGIDTDAAKTAGILLDGYFSIADYKLSYDFTLEELKQALSEGLVIVPTNGQALSNPNFTRPGPLEHMLVITGYDTEMKEFITNDPGTRKGEGYRYPEAVLFDAIREYPTGKHLPITIERKAMIVIPS